MKKIAMYMRLSLEDADKDVESNSITNQRFLLKEFIHGNPEFCRCEVEEYYDDGYSGTNMNRPAVTRLLEEVKKGNTDCIIVKDFSRFSRDYIEMGSYLDQVFPFMGVRFISVNDNYDSKNHKGMTMEMDEAFKTLLYDFYSKDISEKYKVSLASKCAKGEYVFWQTPFGYEKNRDAKNRVRINEREAKIVRYIFQLSGEGLSTVRIAKKLHEEKIPTISQIRKSNTVSTESNVCWNHTVIGRILKNRFYIGEWTYHKTEAAFVGSKKKKAVPKEEWIVQENHHEPLVTMEEFMAVNMKKGNDNKRKHEKHPLTGILYCGGCGYAMSYKREPKRRLRTFKCKMHAQLQIEDCCTYFNAGILEELILSMLNRELLRTADLNESREVMKNSMQSRMSDLKRCIREAENQIDNLEDEKQAKYESYSEGAISAEEYGGSVQAAEDRISNVYFMIEKEKEKLSKLEEQYFKNVDDMKQVVKYMNITELTQEIVDTFIRKIKVYRDKRIEIEWNFNTVLSVPHLIPLDNYITPKIHDLATK